MFSSEIPGMIGGGHIRSYITTSLVSSSSRAVLLFSSFRTSASAHLAEKRRSKTKIPRWELRLHSLRAGHRIIGLSLVPPPDFLAPVPRRRHRTLSAATVIDARVPWQPLPPPGSMPAWGLETGAPVSQLRSCSSTAAPLSLKCFSMTPLNTTLGFSSASPGAVDEANK
jgi:hypothetical protein